MKTLIALALLFVALSAEGQLNYERLTGSTWEVAVGNRILGTLTFKDAETVTTSWQGETKWSKSANGVQIFGVDLTYIEGTFSGHNPKGEVVAMAYQKGADMTAAPVESPASPVSVASAEVKRFEQLESVKLARGNDHAFTVSGQKTAFGRSTNLVWETSWGSYIKEFERSATYTFEVSHFGGEATGIFEVLFLAKNTAGDQVPYAFTSRPVRVNGDMKIEIDIFHQSSDSLYRALNIRIQDGTLPDTWVAWVRNGDTLMGLAAGRGSIADRYKGNPSELIALAKKVVK
jgi:hypothetical protein